MRGQLGREGWADSPDPLEALQRPKGTGRVPVRDNAGRERWADAGQAIELLAGRAVHVHQIRQTGHTVR